MARTLKIAAIPGDGIGKEVMPEGLRVLQAAARRFDIALQFTPIEWASCDYYAQTGQMMPDDWTKPMPPPAPRKDDRPRKTRCNPRVQGRSPTRPPVAE